MPKLYERECDFCGISYRGPSKFFCGMDCYNGYRAAKARGRTGKKLGFVEPDPELEIQIDGDTGTLRVEGSVRISTPEALWERASLDKEEWEFTDGWYKSYEGFLKDNDGNPVVVPMFSVTVKFRRKLINFFSLAPIVLKISSPSFNKPDMDNPASVHFGDLHLPYHSPKALNLLYQVLDLVNPYLVVDHGDTLDCHAISKYQKNPKERTPLNAELEMAARHHATVHTLTPDAEHLWLLGNHEDRLRRLIWGMADDRAAGEVLTLPTVTHALKWENLVGVGDLGWEILEYPEHKLIHNRLILKHGDVIRHGSGSSARSEYAKYRKSGMSGHSHRIGYFGQRDYNGTHGWWEIGMLGKVEQRYVTWADWHQGFCVVTWSKDRRKFAVEQCHVLDGKCFFRGNRLTGDAKGFGDLATDG
jgi:hypothetical protein